MRLTAALLATSFYLWRPCTMTKTSNISAPEFHITHGGKTAVIFGSTGLIGNFCLRALLTHQSYEKVISIGRNPIKATHPKLKHHIIDFENLDAYKKLIAGNDLFICLGTTLKKAGSKEAFRKIDYELVFQIAKIASLNDMSQILLVSALGADQESMFFYNRVKGELEEAVRKLPFWAVHIFQPSLLLGDRQEERLMEQIAVKVSRVVDRFTGPLLGKYRPIQASTVAKAMANAAQQIKKGTFYYRSPDLEQIAAELQS